MQPPADCVVSSKLNFWLLLSHIVSLDHTRDCNGPFPSTLLLAAYRCDPISPRGVPKGSDFGGKYLLLYPYGILIVLFSYRRTAFRASTAHAHVTTDHARSNIIGPATRTCLIAFSVASLAHAVSIRIVYRHRRWYSSPRSDFGGVAAG